jgi:NitT/TauT family transport system permease protein
MSTVAPARPASRPSPLLAYVPALTGLATVAGFFVLMEVLIRAGVISRFIVPPPSEIIASFGRVIVEEHVFRRFLLTLGECLTAGVMITVFGVAGGVLMHRYKLLQQACETWVAAFAAAPVVLAYPLFMVIFGRSAWTIIMIGFVAALPPVILKTLEGMSGTRKVLVNVGKSFNLTGSQQFWKIMFPAALPTIFVGIRLGLIFALINIVGVEFLINYGGLGQLINDLAERYDLAGTYAAICFVILVSVCVFILLERLERWLRPVD